MRATCTIVLFNAHYFILLSQQARVKESLTVGVDSIHRTRSMSFIQTSVPLVFWGRNPPVHEITCICRTEEKKGVATGSLSGQVCLWDICKERETEKVKVELATWLNTFI